TITFSDGGTNLATVPVDASGQARLSTSGLDLGSHPVSAAYSGDSTFLASASGALMQTVNPTLQVWRGGTLATWSNPANWVAGVVPSAGDSVLFTSGNSSLTAVVDPGFAGIIAGFTVDASWNGTIIVNRSLTIANGLNLASGTWKGDGAVTFAGSSQWTGGTVTLGAGGLTSTGTLTLAGVSLA